MVEPVTLGVQSSAREVTGYVDAVTSDRALGWAWAPRQPALRVDLELRLGEQVVAVGCADQLRPDLVGSGVGDGHHAFELAIPDAFRTRSAELHVVAKTASGVPVTLGKPPVAAGVNDQIARLAHGIDILVNSQRVLHRTMQATLAAADGATLAKLAETQATMGEQFATLERFVVRLDEQLLKLAPSGAPAGRRMPPVTIWSLAVASLALVLGVAGLVRSLAG